MRVKTGKFARGLDLSRELEVYVDSSKNVIGYFMTQSIDV
jgi:hypothetical protein